MILVKCEVAFCEFLSPAHQYLCKNCFINSKIFYGAKLSVDFSHMGRPLATLARQFGIGKVLMSFFLSTQLFDTNPDQ